MKIMQTELKEIGSEFWLEEQKFQKKDSINYFNIGKDNKFLLSGRTAIYFVLEDILKRRKVKHVYFPSYCCDSMLQPFIDKNIEIEFYEVNYNNGFAYNIDTNKECDVFFAMNYFGFTENNMNEYIKKIKENGAIVIEDITHSLLSPIRNSESADYLVASLRKWFPIVTGGLAVKMNGEYLIKQHYKENKKIVEIKKDAMKLKYEYIKENKEIQKEEFLRKYGMANDILKNDYKRYSIDDISLKILREMDINAIKEQRRKNAKMLYDNLKNTKITFAFKELKDIDCPLFVPILLRQEERENVRKYLIDNSIFCPIHWQRPTLIRNNNILYTSELSLVCDQRYTEKEIEKYIKLMIEYIKEK